MLMMKKYNRWWEDMNFIKIDGHAEEVIKTSSFLAKVKGRDEKVIEMLNKKYREDITDYDNALALCFYQWFLADDKLNLADTNSVFQITFDVINKIEDTLDQRPEYWILWILKYKIISFMNFNEDELIGNLRELIEWQDADDKMPYYIVADILLAHIYYSKGNTDQACKILENILRKYSEKVSVLHNFFEGFVIEFRNLLLRSGEENLLLLTGRIQETYF